VVSAVSLAVVGASVLLAGCGAHNPFRSGVKSFRGPDEVAVPYGAQDKADLTGAVTAVNTRETEHLQDVLDMLRGHVAGLYVRELPDGEILLEIRGGAQSLTSGGAPLLVIDDMPVGPQGVRLALKSLSPRDVESIQVLKDLSTTAVYGTRGANGVILIYLKR
jgi:TonB-dependent SusC/RagA subfamily outer membrane receptor